MNQLGEMGIQDTLELSESQLLIPNKRGTCMGRVVEKIPRSKSAICAIVSSIFTLCLITMGIACFVWGGNQKVKKAGEITFIVGVFMVFNTVLFGSVHLHLNRPRQKPSEARRTTESSNFEL